MFELFIRGICIGALLAAGLSMLRGGPLNAPRFAGALFSVATCGFVVHTSAVLPELLGPLRHVAWILSAGGTAYFWLFGMALFSDGPLRPQHAIPPLVMTSIVVTGRLLPPGGEVGTDIVHNLLEILLVAHVLSLIWTARRSDLVETRLALRPPFIASVGVFCIVLSGFDIAWSLGYQDPWVKEFQAMALALMALAGSYTLTQGRASLFDRAPTPVPSTNAVDATPIVAMLDSDEAEDPETQARFSRLLEDESFWRRQGLTIAETAAHAGVQEYRLRRLINHSMGYRNFPDFLNARRIAMAKRDLAAPDKAHMQVSTIAYDLGYASLGPFNRAFRAATGQSPTEWRKTVANT